MSRRPLVLIHGYSASGRAFDRWRQIFETSGYDATVLHVSSYQTLTNEVTIKDLAEAFDRALRIQVGLDKNEDFDAVVHSTGMLVIRSWLSIYAERRRRLKHLVGLAPATFGSPLAHKGRGWLGAIFRGNREKGPDFLEAGDLVLDGLELGSRFTWDLAEQDLLGEETFYGTDTSTPFVSIFCGTSKYGFPLNVISEDGTDGTVRLAGTPLNSRKVTLDLTLDRARDAAIKRVDTAPWSNVDTPVVPIEDTDHGSIMNNPPQVLIDFVMRALEVEDEASFKAWQQEATQHAETVFKKLKDGGRLATWQQFVMRVRDERGDPVPDYYIEFLKKEKGKRKWKPLQDYKMSVHPYTRDTSLRCFHVNLDTLTLEKGDTLGVRLIALSGSQLIAYVGYSDDSVEVYADYDTHSEWSGVIDLSTLPKIQFFYPFTTTLVDIKLNREPQPSVGRNDLLFFLGPSANE